MFHDDRMIPVLTVLLLMVVMGTMLQRVDGLERWLGGEAPIEIALRDDEVSGPVNSLLSIDVFANDDGVDQAIREKLTVVTAPACGRLNIRSGVLEYLAGKGCEGRHTIRYSFDGAEPGQVASVTARIRGSGTPVASAPPPGTSHAATGRSTPPPGTARAAAEASASPAGSDAAVAGASAPPAASDAALSGAPDPAVAQASAARAPVRTAAPPSHPAATDLASGRASPAMPTPGSTGAVATSGGPSPVAPEIGPAIADAARATEPVGIAASPDGHPPAILAAAGPRIAVADPAGPSEPALAHAPAPDVSAPAGPINLPIAPRSAAHAPAVPGAPSSLSAADLAARLALAAPPFAAARPGSPTLAGLSPDLPAVPPSARDAGTGAEVAPAAAPISVAGRESLVTAALSPGASAPTTPAPSLSAAGPGREPHAAPLATSAEPAIGGAVTGAPAPDGGETRLAALPAGTAASSGSGESASAEPMRPGVRLAALLPPPDADRPSAAAVLPDRDGMRPRRLPTRPEPAAAPGRAPLAAPRPAAPRAVVPANGSAPVRAADESPAVIAAATGGPAFVLAAFGHGEGSAPAVPGTGATAIAPAGQPGPDAADGVRLAALAPPHLSRGPWLPGSALDVLPVEPEAPPSPAGRMVMPVPRPASIPGVAAAAAAATDPKTAAYPDIVARCVTVPGLTLDVRSAGMTVLGVDAPCHAGTVAELTYSGLGLAVPLDGNGQGSVTVLGFEPNTPALVTFSDGASLDFELPFRGVDRVSRVALAWDSAVELGLNAFERGAAPNSPGHVRPGAARSLEEARSNGGGYLSVWWPVAGVGQSVQVYSWYHHRGESPGVVRMLVDFVSRDRDHLDSACGNGRNAAPQFMVLRSDAGRPERPVIRRIAPLDCGQVAEDGHDNRLISGAVDDLVITSR